jgi:TPP-dependent 2-oxoacid decarboxylase
MAILNPTVITVDAILTTKGRELLARNDGSFQITHQDLHTMVKQLKILLY